MSLADLLRPPDLTQTPDRVTRTPEPDTGLMTGTILGFNPLRVKIPEYDGGKLSHRAFGWIPRGTDHTNASVGDTVKVRLDSRNGFVVVAWEPA